MYIRKRIPSILLFLVLYSIYIELTVDDFLQFIFLYIMSKPRNNKYVFWANYTKIYYKKIGDLN
ncbi:hypothetical protein AN642_01335 [Epulopiscium sp. SCG-B10WGA-EpuloA2]|nr:hypothetical protein AN642_01335 [Epulopiscium sp. SCG-B10WGA-EpuloA2]